MAKTRKRAKPAQVIVDPLVDAILSAVKALKDEFIIILSQVEVMSHATEVTDRDLSELHRSAKRCVSAVDELVRITEA